ncbi:C-type lectin-like isoform X2 [Littorina saxatilis]|uniref:C-type lectin domain-containing protein n=2 Tax=Littorina saxatilis TaxID=31220 RepID=A0AAN9GMF8_9CAEN
MMQLFKSLPIAWVVLLLWFQGHSTAEAVCPEHWTTDNDSCYILMEQKKTWKKAQSTCRKFGGNLATIANPSENHVLDKLLPETEAWIGLRDHVNEGTFKWIKTSTTPLWTNWAPGEPNNARRNEYCVVIMPGGNWNDEPCSYIRKFICEKPA